MRYMLLFYVNDRPEPGTPEAEAFFGAMFESNRELRERGVLLAGEPLHAPDAATTVRVRGGEIVISDGPFAEATEWLGGSYLLDCSDLDEALELAALAPTAATGSVEVRPIMAVGG